MSFERLKDYLSGVTFEVSLAKGYIYSRKNHSKITRHIYTKEGAKEWPTYMFRRAMQVRTGFDLGFADHVNRWRKQNDVSKNGDGK